MEKQLQPGTIRQQALAALEKSTKLFEIAENLVGQGNESEAEWVRNEARAQRNISVWLMAKANKRGGQAKTEPQAEYPGPRLQQNHRDSRAQNHTHR